MNEVNQLCGCSDPYGYGSYHENGIKDDTSKTKRQGF